MPLLKPSGVNAATSPRGSVIHIYDTAKRKLRILTEIPDVCGIVAKYFGYCITAGTGKIINLSDNGAKTEALSTLRWDNHLITIRATKKEYENI